MQLQLRRCLFDQCCFTVSSSLFSKYGSFLRHDLPVRQFVNVLCIGTGAVQMRMNVLTQQCHLIDSVSGSVRSIKFADRFASVTACRLHDRPWWSVVHATHYGRVQHQVRCLAFVVCRKICSHMGCSRSCRIFCHVCDMRINCCEIRNKLESSFVVTALKALGTTEVTRIQDQLSSRRNKIVPLLR